MLSYKDSEGKICSTTIQNMVAQSMVSQVQSDYSRKLVQLANNLKVSEDYEGMLKVTSRLQAIEESSRLSRKQAYIETNIAALRKSIF